MNVNSMDITYLVVSWVVYTTLSLVVSLVLPSVIKSPLAVFYAVVSSVFALGSVFWIAILHIPTVLPGLFLVLIPTFILVSVYCALEAYRFEKWERGKRGEDYPTELILMAVRRMKK